MHLQPDGGKWRHARPQLVGQQILICPSSLQLALVRPLQAAVKQHQRQPPVALKRIVEQHLHAGPLQPAHLGLLLQSHLLALIALLNLIIVLLLIHRKYLIIFDWPL